MEISETLVGRKPSDASGDTPTQFVKIDPINVKCLTNDRRLIESHNTPGNEKTATNAVATETGTAKFNYEDLSYIMAAFLKDTDDIPLTDKHLHGKLGDIATAEETCIGLWRSLMPKNNPPDILDYLLLFPRSKLISLQITGKRPSHTVHTWYANAHKDGRHVGTSKDYLDGFRVALEMCATVPGWSEYEVPAAGDEGRQKVINGQHFSSGTQLVAQLLQDLDIAKPEQEAVAKADLQHETTPLSEISEDKPQAASKQTPLVKLRETAPEVDNAHNTDEKGGVAPKDTGKDPADS